MSFKLLKVTNVNWILVQNLNEIIIGQRYSGPWARLTNRRAWQFQDRRDMHPQRKRLVLSFYMELRSGGLKEAKQTCSSPSLEVKWNSFLFPLLNILEEIM